MLLLRQLMKYLPQTRSRQFALFALISFIIFIIYLSITGKCNMSPNLETLLLYTITQLQKRNIEYWLDYGTLLGAIRDKSILPHEFDNDLGMMESECSKLLALKQIFKEEMGYTIYSRGDYIPQKSNRLLGYSPYISTPCARIYDAKLQYYTDVYWYVRLTRDQVIQRIETNPQSEDAHDRAPILEWNYQETDGDLLCNYEGLTPGEVPGGCRRAIEIFPLKEIEFLHHRVTVPNDSIANLRHMYGDSWQKPSPKGYKAMMCAIVPDSNVLYFSFIFLILTSLIIWKFGMRIRTLIFGPPKPQLRYTQL